MFLYASGPLPGPQPLFERLLTAHDEEICRAVLQQMPNRAPIRLPEAEVYLETLWEHPQWRVRQGVMEYLVGHTDPELSARRVDAWGIARTFREMHLKRRDTQALHSLFPLYRRVLDSNPIWATSEVLAYEVTCSAMRSRGACRILLDILIGAECRLDWLSIANRLLALEAGPCQRPGDIRYRSEAFGAILYRGWACDSSMPVATGSML